MWGVFWRRADRCDERRWLFLTRSAALEYADALNAGAASHEELATVHEERFDPPPAPRIEWRLTLSLPMAQELPPPERVVHTGPWPGADRPVRVERVRYDQEVWHVHGTDREAVAAAAQELLARGG